MPKPKPNETAARAYRITTPLGTWRAVFSDRGLRELTLPRHPSKPNAESSAPELNGQEGAKGTRLRTALDARLKGNRADLPLSFFDLEGRPPFFRRVWEAMHAIPFGEVRSYGDLAKAAGSAKAVRAAGQACGANPVVLFLPCHRVVAGSGPGGFGGGMEWKRRLLALEGFALNA